jgi:hypothetical protein
LVRITLVVLFLEATTYNAVDELDVPGALRIAVTRAKFSAGFVSRVLGQATVGVHGDEVQRAVQTAADVGNINIERELVAQKGEHLVLGIVLHEIQAATNILAIRALGDKLEAECVAGSGHTVGAGIVGAVNAAVRRASLAIRAELGVPGIAVIAVGRA